MSQVYKFKKLDENVVSIKVKEQFRINTQILVPKNHLCIIINCLSMEKQRMFEGKQKIRALEKKTLFGINLSSKKYLYDLYLINKDFKFEDKWGGRFLFEDKPTKNEISIGVNGIIRFGLKDYESLYEIMEKKDLEVIDRQTIGEIYGKEKISMNNAIINFLSDWSSQTSSIKDIQNKKNEVQELIKSNLNKQRIFPFIVVSQILINGYISPEGDLLKGVKNNISLGAFEKKSSVQRDKEIIIIKEENVDNDITEERGANNE